MDIKKTKERADLDTLLKCLESLESFVVTSIDISEKPDFIISSGLKKIGIEHTRAVYQETVRAGKLHLSECRDIPIVVTDLKDREIRRSNEEILASITDFSTPWENSEESALEWKEKIAKTLKTKRQKYNQRDYQVFDENWLLIHDDPPLPNQNLVQYRTERDLLALFQETSGVARDFNTVFVCSGHFLFRWHKGKLQLANTTIVTPLTLIHFAT